MTFAIVASANVSSATASATAAFTTASAAASPSHLPSPHPYHPQPTSAHIAFPIHPIHAPADTSSSCLLASGRRR